MNETHYGDEVVLGFTREAIRMHPLTVFETAGCFSFHRAAYVMAGSDHAPIQAGDGSSLDLNCAVYQALCAAQLIVRGPRANPIRCTKGKTGYYTSHRQHCFLFSHLCREWTKCEGKTVAMHLLEDSARRGRGRQFGHFVTHEVGEAMPSIPFSQLQRY